ncbi:hypothetical protein [Paenibacillus sp. MMS20-IR301]|uniref:hypothetical protein n=1 Tax=Paenibacillus sp. MMS20-IR301 TaxID=2895946 RepID=UPI0028E384E5|nr:hypothetical protein [Paenibacillus sp. MMS20-IR301]WNS43763.1 hypothetical protein LOS79_00400 [Paenibacillus sp. MMS20-IR301]
MAITADESNWPLVRISLGETFDQETVEEYIAYWEAVLSRRTPFGLLMIQTGERGDRPAKEVTKHYMDWCKAHKEEIASVCAGIAVVMPTAKLLALYKPVTALSTKKMYGCPGGAFGSEEEAAGWLQGLLNKAD